jgi:hypothetical protein
VLPTAPPGGCPGLNLTCAATAAPAVPFVVRNPSPTNPSQLVDLKKKQAEEKKFADAEVRLALLRQPSSQRCWRHVTFSCSATTR